MSFKEIFKRILIDWQERRLPKLIEREIDIKTSKSKIIALIGPRRAGKTSIMYQTIEKALKRYHKENIIFIDFEDYRLIGLRAKDFDELFIAHEELFNAKPKFLFFDEIQNLDHWSKILRTLHNKNEYVIVISGSTSKLSSYEISTELRGRYKSILVLPFSFKEFLKFKRFEYNDKLKYSKKKGKLLRLFNEYLHYGGFPEVIKTKSKNEKFELIKSYFETIYYKDILERYDIENKELMLKLMTYLIDINGKEFSLSKFYKMLKSQGFEISKKTISQYLQYLEDSFFIFTSQKYSHSPKVRILNPKKVYLVDNAFYTFLSKTMTKDIGNLLESLVMQHLKRKGYECFYFKQNRECDFVARKDNKLIAIQVTKELNDDNIKREIEGIKECMKSLNIKEGFVLVYDSPNINKIDNIPIKSVWEFLLHF